MKWVLWAILLIIQNFAFTLVSRARNSGSLRWHAIASVFSNGVWFVSQLILIDNVMAVLRNSAWDRALVIGLFYSTCTVTGSVSSHWISMRFIEKGKRRVGVT